MVERSNNWIHISVNTGKRNLYMSVYPWSAQNRSKLMSRVADFSLNIQLTDLMERYETFLWTQIIQFFQPIAEWVPILLKSIDKISVIKIKQSVS
jgi:pantothenate kinase-related protein Tda10